MKKRLDSILPELDSIKLDIDKMRGEYKKRIKLNILAASTFVINAITSYREEHGDVIFDFEQNEAKTDCDILITTGTLGKLERRICLKRFVKTERIYLAVPRSSHYACRASVSLHEMREESFVMLSSSRLFGAICNKFCSIAGFAPKILFESDSPSAVQNIIGTGTGVAFWPEYSWGMSNNERVVLLPVSYPECERELIIELSDRRPLSEAAEEFYAYLISRLGGDVTAASQPARDSEQTRSR